MKNKHHGIVTGSGKGIGLAVVEKLLQEREQILNAYNWLTNNIVLYKKQKKINNYNNTIQGKIHNKKDEEVLGEEKVFQLPTNVDISLLFIFAVSSLGVYGVILSG